LGDRDVVTSRSVVSGPIADEVIHHWSRVLRGEYLEIPGLSLTRRQIQRLWELDDVLVEQILDVLIVARFLRPTPEGGYVRVEDERDITVGRL
jgi:hypothetical protein